MPARLRHALLSLRAGLRRSPVRLTVFSALAVAASWSALGQSGGTDQFRDAQTVHGYELVAERSLTTYGQLPLWNPWSCGGLYLTGSPQSRVASPTVLLTALAGARRAEGALLVLFLVLGMEGFYRWARLRQAAALGPALAAPLFALAGHFGVNWSNGWVQFLGFLLLPWVLYGATLLVRGRPAGLVYVGGGFALMLGFGGTYPVPLSALFVVAEVVRALLERRWRARWSVALPLLGAGGLLTAGLCVFRLWPIVETLAQGPRVMAGAPGHGLSELWGMLAVMGTPQAGGSAGIHYVAPVAWVLAAAALLRWRRAAWPLLVGAAAVWLAAGYGARPSAFALLRELPVYETLRYPARFLMPFALYLAALCALGISSWMVLARRRGGRWEVVPALLVAVAAAGWGLQTVSFDHLTRRAQVGPALPQVDQPFAQARGNRWLALHFLALNRGSIQCGEAYPVPMSPLLRGDLPAEEYPLDAATGTVERLEWTPNRLELAVHARAPMRVLVNQNWHPGWRASAGKAMGHDGLLAVDVPAGEHRLTLRFLPRSALGGGAVSLLALAVVVGVLAGWPSGRERRTRAALAALGLSALPFAALGAIAALWEEPTLPPRLTNPDGGPIIVDAVPADAVAVDARFDVPVRLLAIRLPPEPDEHGVVPLELYWRVDGDVPRSVGIFVHVTGPGARQQADHPVVAGTWFFKKAPRGVLLRDATGVAQKEWPPGEWRVLVGLWHAGGDGSRVGARDRRGARVPDGRVDAAGFTVQQQPSSPPEQPEGQPVNP